MQCHRCGCFRLIRLDKKLAEDNDVYRCSECGYLFSPGNSDTLAGQGRTPSHGK